MGDVKDKHLEQQTTVERIGTFLEIKEPTFYLIPILATGEGSTW